jgi:hypothetical protein
MSLILKWTDYYKATDAWPATKAYRRILFGLLTSEQIKSYQDYGVFKEQQYTVAYGGHYNVWDGDFYFCTTVNNREPAVEQILVGEVCLLRAEHTLAKIAYRYPGTPVETPFVYRPPEGGRNKISGQIAFAGRNPLLHSLKVCIGIESAPVFNQICRDYPA